MAESLAFADLRKSAARKRQDAASVAMFLVAMGLVASIGIIFVHTSVSSPTTVLAALINLEPRAAESGTMPINFAQNKPKVLQLTSDLGVCFSSAATVDDGAKYIQIN